MLILDPSTIDAIRIGDDVIISFHEMRGKKKIGFTAPKEIGINRITAEQFEALTGSKLNYFLKSRGENGTS